MASAISYTPGFQHQDWIDNVDRVQAQGSNGFNDRFHKLEIEFQTISGVVGLLSAGIGAFQSLGAAPVGASVAVAYGGNVGIGANFSSGSPPIRPLEVNLDVNTGPAQQVRFGNAVCCNGGVGNFSGYAVFCHANLANAPDSNFALRQGPSGDVHINSPGKPVTFRQNGTLISMGISAKGRVIVGGDAELAGAPDSAVLQVAGDAYKSVPGGQWAPSDARVKEDVRDLEAGLAQLREVRPVRFRYNGLAGTPAGREGVGVLGQEIEKIFPETIRLTSCHAEGGAHFDDFRIFDGSALTFALINAVKELAAKVEQLEQALADAGRRSRLGN